MAPHSYFGDKNTTSQGHRRCRHRLEGEVVQAKDTKRRRKSEWSRFHSERWEVEDVKEENRPTIQERRKMFEKSKEPKN